MTEVTRQPYSRSFQPSQEPPRRDFHRVPHRDVAAFDIAIHMTVNMAMVSQIVDVFDQASDAGIKFPKEAYAFYKQLGNFVGTEE